jgi:hypothetical protein
MKPSLKKLKTCLYAKSSGPTGFFARESHQPAKLSCDHPQMKVEWKESVCIDCGVYVNKNKPPEPEPAPETKKKRATRKKAKEE